MSALDTVVEVSPSIPWSADWLDRTLPSLYNGSLYFQQALCLSVVAISIISMVRTKGLRKQLRENPSDRASIVKQINERTIIVPRTSFFVANLFLFGLYFIAGVDAYLSFVSLKSDVEEHRDMWTPAFVLALAGLTAGFLALFAAVSVVVPFVQVCVAFYFLTRFARKRGEQTLAPYITEARGYSTSIAFMWASVSFLIQAWTSPMDGGLWRWVFLQGAIGSTFAWLDASYAFTFCPNRLKDREIELSTAGVKDVVAMFGKTVVAVHSKGERDALLPKYEAVSQEPTDLDEKASA